MVALLALALLSPAQTPQEEVVAWVNGIRIEENLGPLKRNALLDLAAQRYAAELAREDRFSHTDSRNQGPGERVRQAGYADFERVAENLALNTQGAQDTVKLWMESPPHRQALLTSDLREMGVGKAVGPSGPVWVWLGGARFDDYPVMVELDMPETDRDEVSVWASGAANATNMRWRWAGSDWSTWFASVNVFSVPIMGGNGERMLEVEYRMRSGAVLRASDGIRRTQ
ncbi:MAG: CAP domain-containing protein [Fimbriimonadaceae bacterium]|nr:CAP domain-containing protein [Fimbriimonadaceae bacterium]